MALYMKFGDIQGEVTETKHKGWIAIDSISFGCSRNSFVEVGSGQEKRHRDQPSVNDMNCSRSLDKSSPLLFNQSMVGEPTDVTIHCMRPANKPNAEPLLYLEYKLRNVLICSYSVSNSEGGGSESLALNFTAIDIYYTPYDDKDKAGTKGKGYFDLVDAKAVAWSTPT